jgi:hypothetical protein
VVGTGPVPRPLGEGSEVVGGVEVGRRRSGGVEPAPGRLVQHDGHEVVREDPCSKLPPVEEVLDGAGSPPPVGPEQGLRTTVGREQRCLQGRVRHQRRRQRLQDRRRERRVVARHHDHHVAPGVGQRGHEPSERPEVGLEVDDDRDVGDHLGERRRVTVGGHDHHLADRLAHRLDGTCEQRPAVDRQATLVLAHAAGAAAGQHRPGDRVGPVRGLRGLVAHGPSTNSTPSSRRRSTVSRSTSGRA